MSFWDSITSKIGATFSATPDAPNPDALAAVSASNNATARAIDPAPTGGFFDKLADNLGALVGSSPSLDPKMTGGQPQPPPRDPVESKGSGVRPLLIVGAAVVALYLITRE